MTKLSYDAVWADLAAMARSNASVLLIMAGVFLLLPNFAQALFAPQPKIESFDWNAVQQLNDYFRENLFVLILCQLPVWIGSAAILALLLDPKRLSVGEALSTAAGLAISIVVLNWLLNLAIFGGFLFLLIPGLYLIGRLSVAGPLQMAEHIRNPILPMQRSMELTRGNGWRITGLVLLFAIVAGVAGSAFNAVVGIVLTFLLPEVIMTGVADLLKSFIGAASALLILLLSAAIYRQLSLARPS
jgi:hypothetical protein